MLAIPDESVSAVAEAGEIVASVESVLKVTTVLATGAPVASLTVALTVAGAPVDIELVALPAALVIAKVIVGVAAVVPSLPVVPPDEPLPGKPVELAEPPAPPDPQPASMANAVARKSDADNRAIFDPSEPRLTYEILCTQASHLRKPGPITAAHATVHQFYYKHNKLKRIFNVESVLSRGREKTA